MPDRMLLLRSLYWRVDGVDGQCPFYKVPRMGTTLLELPFLVLEGSFHRRSHSPSQHDYRGLGAAERVGMNFSLRSMYPGCSQRVIGDAKTSGHRLDCLHVHLHHDGDHDSGPGHGGHGMALFALL